MNIITRHITNWLVGCLTARQYRKVHLCQLRGKPAQSVKDGQRDTMHINLFLHDNNVTQFTVKHCSYINATTDYLIE